MDGSLPFILAGTALAILGVMFALLRRPLHHRWQQQEVRRAMQAFRLQRETLEAKFFDIAARTGKPRGLRWVDCDWHDAVTFARDRQSGLLTAFVAVNISFEAIPGGDMEGVAAVGNLRDAAAVFHYQGGRWGTGGRALFNMNPDDALVRLQNQFEPVSAA